MIMSTLFQLHTGITDYKKHIQQIYSYGQADDGVLIIGQAVSLCELILEYANELDVKKYQNISWYALETDLDNFSSLLRQNSIVDSEQMKVISDIKWVELVQGFDKVVTLTD